MVYPSLGQEENRGAEGLNPLSLEDAESLELVYRARDLQDDLVR